MILRSDNDIQKFKYILSGVGNPEFSLKIINDETIAIESKPFLFSVSILMEQAHNLDLLRCFSQTSYKQATDRILSAVEESIENEKAKKDLEILRTTAYKRIYDTGDIASYGWSSAGPISTPRDAHKYRKDDFIVASTDPVGCMKKISLLSENFVPPRLTNKAITIPPMTEDISKNLQEELSLLSQEYCFFSFKVNEYILNIVHYIKFAYPEKTISRDGMIVMNSIAVNSNRNIENICGIELMAKIVIDPGNGSCPNFIFKDIAHLVQQIPKNASNKNFLDLMNAIHERGGGYLVGLFSGTMYSMPVESVLNPLMSQLTSSEIVKGKVLNDLIKELCDALQNSTVSVVEKNNKIVNIMKRISPDGLDEKLVADHSAKKWTAF